MFDDLVQLCYSERDNFCHFSVLAAFDVNLTEPGFRLIQITNKTQLFWLLLLLT